MEAAGIGMGVIGLLNDCLKVFEYVQLGRQFGRDFESCQLRLDLARVRLGRWAEAVNITDNPLFSPCNQHGEVAQLAGKALDNIKLLAREADKKSKRYEETAAETIGLHRSDLVLSTDKDMQPLSHGLHLRLSSIAKKRQKGTSLAKKVGWALYDRKSFDELIRGIATYIDELEMLVPSKPEYQRLARLEMSGVETQAPLEALRDASEGVDSMLHNMTTRKIDAISLNSGKHLVVDEGSVVLIGNQYHDEYNFEAISLAGRPIQNTAYGMVVKGRSKVQIGNHYGM